MLPPSLSYSRPAVVLAVVGMLMACVLAVTVGARLAAYVLAGLIGGFGLARAFLPKARLEPFVIRDRWVDVAIMGGVALALALLTSIAPF